MSNFRRLSVSLSALNWFKTVGVVQSHGSVGLHFLDPSLSSAARLDPWGRLHHQGHHSGPAQGTVALVAGGFTELVARSLWIVKNDDNLKMTCTPWSIKACYLLVGFFPWYVCWHGRN